jgi:hypothetical protein
MSTPTMRGGAPEVAPWVDGAISKTTDAVCASGDVICVIHHAQGAFGEGMNAPTTLPDSNGWRSPVIATEDGWAPTAKVWTTTLSASGARTIALAQPGATGESLHAADIYILIGATETPEGFNSAAGDSTSGHVVPSADATSADSLVIRSVDTRGGLDAAGPSRYSWPTSTERTEGSLGNGSGGGTSSTATRVSVGVGAQGTETVTGTAVTTWGENVALIVIFGGAGGGGATVDVAGDRAVTATATGALAVDTAIAGAVSITAARTGTLAVDTNTDGARATTAAMTGTAAVDRMMAGTRAVSVGLTGTLDVAGRVDVDGDRTIAAALAGALAVDTAVAGNRVTAVGLAGAIDVVAPTAVDGVRAVAAGLAGDVSVTRPASGTRPIAVTMTGSLAVVGAFTPAPQPVEAGTTMGPSAEAFTRMDPAGGATTLGPGVQ